MTTMTHQMVNALLTETDMPNLVWRCTPPDRPGMWWPVCTEDPAPSLVQVFIQSDGAWMAQDRDLDLQLLKDLHEGLTDAEWAIADGAVITHDIAHDCSTTTVQRDFIENPAKQVGTVIDIKRGVVPAPMP